MMENIKNLYRFQKINGIIVEMLQIQQLYFVKQHHFNNLIQQINKISQNSTYYLYDTFIKHIQRNLRCKSNIFRILFMIHQLLRSIDTESLIQVSIKILLKLSKMLQVKNTFLTNDIEIYLTNKFCLPYINYLTKIFSSVLEQKQQRSSKIIKKYKSQNKQNKNRNPILAKQYCMNHQKPLQNIDYKLLQIQNIDFSIFNKISEILKFDDSLHQMGRYYSSHQYIINFYMECLKDLNNYLSLIHAKVKLLTKLQQKLSTEIQQKLLTEIQQKCQEKLQSAIYLYVLQAQRSISKISSFFYNNKYLYPYVNEMIQMKLTIQLPQKFIKKYKKNIRKQTNTNRLLWTQTKQDQNENDQIGNAQTKDTGKQIMYRSHIIDSIAQMSSILKEMQESS